MIVRVNVRVNIAAMLAGAIALLSGCRSVDSKSAERDDQVPIVVGSGTTSSSSASGGGARTGSAPLRLGTWNLRNFSKWGTTEYRIGGIASEIEQLDVDILGVQELKVTDDTQGDTLQAWNVLLDELQDYEGFHNPWNTFDSTVGLIYKPATTTLLDSRPLFDDDSFAFPRPPLEATFAISKGEESVELTLIVLHLKAFGDSVARRRAACDKLDTYLSETPGARVVLLGDLNDDPHDPAEDNAFVGTFLDAEPTYHFITRDLPPESVTSLGFYHWVEGMKIDGEFLDHFILTEGAMNRFAGAKASISSVPIPDRADFEDTRSDHFPVVLELTP